MTTSNTREFGAALTDAANVTTLANVTDTPLATDRSAAVSWTKDGYTLSDDRSRLNIEMIHRFLSESSWWAKGMPREILERAMAHSLPFGIYAPDGAQIGFARVVTDYTVFAYLRDVFVLPEHGGRGLATWATTVMRDHPRLLDVGNWMLATSDAHSLYERAGYKPSEHPEWFMQVKRPGWRKK